MTLYERGIVAPLSPDAKRNLKRLPRHALDSAARELDIPHPDWSNKDDLIDRILAVVEKKP